jgi:hypothetical protein
MRAFPEDERTRLNIVVSTMEDTGRAEIRITKDGFANRIETALDILQNSVQKAFISKVEVLRFK